MDVFMKWVGFEKNSKYEKKSINFKIYNIHPHMSVFIQMDAI